MPAGTAVPALADATTNEHTCTAVFISGFAPEFLRGGSEGLNASTRPELGEQPGLGKSVETTGAGPFFHLGEHVEFEETLLEGEPCVFDHASAIGKWGPIFLELIEFHEVTPELESRFYTGGAGGSNIAHIAYIVDDPAAESERLEAAGMPKFLYLRQGPIQISLHDAPLLGHAIEVHENTDAINGLFALCAAGAEGWDGSEPLREMPEG